MQNEALLKKALENGLIDLSAIQSQMEEMERQSYLEMHTSIWQGSNGKWYTRLPKPEGGKQLIKRSSRKDIEDLVVQFYKENSKAPTFCEVFKLWCDEKIELKEFGLGTRDRYVNDFKRFFGEWELKNSSLSDITEEDIEDIIKANIKKYNLTNKAYSNMRTLLTGIFKYGKKHKYTEVSISSFFGDLEISKKSFAKNKKDPQSQVFTEEEVKKLINWLGDHPTVENYGLILTFQTGIREGELAALKFSDVSNNKLHIQRQEIKYKVESRKVNHEIVDYAKTDAGDRIIFLPQSALDTINNIRRLNPNNDFMMISNGRKVLTNTFNDRLYDACDAVGIPRRSMHKIRKTYGTTLIDGGVEDSFVMSQMGHADIATTRKYYYYSNKNDNHKLEQIERVLGGVTFGVTSNTF